MPEAGTALGQNSIREEWINLIGLVNYGLLAKVRVGSPKAIETDSCAVNHDVSRRYLGTLIAAHGSMSDNAC
jgi:hypothetical protein